MSLKASTQAASVFITQEALDDFFMNTSALAESMPSCPASGKCDFMDFAPGARTLEFQPPN